MDENISPFPDTTTKDLTIKTDFPTPFCEIFMKEIRYHSSSPNTHKLVRITVGTR